MTSLELIVFFKDVLLCCFYEWDDIRCERGRLIVYHSDGESTMFEGRHYSYAIREVKNDTHFTPI